MKNRTLPTVVKRCGAATGYGISHRQFVADMVRAGREKCAVWNQTVLDRDFQTMTIVWASDRSTGQLVCAYELPGGA